MSYCASRQTLSNTRQHLLSERVAADSLGELGGEGVEDHLLRRLLFDTARAQIEQLLFVNAPHRRPVAAFHVIGVNFQLRFGVDLRQPPEQQIIVGHLTVGFQRERRDVDQPVKHRPPLIADDGFVQLAAGAVADLMVEPGAAIADLIFHRHRQRIEAQVAVFAAQAGAGLVTQHLAAKQETAAEGRGVAAQQQVVMGEVIAAGILKCQLDMLEVRVIGHRHGQSPAGEMRLLIEAQVMLDNRRLRPALQRQVMAIVGGIQRIAGQATGDMHQQQRFIQAAVARHANAGHRLGQAFGHADIERGGMIDGNGIQVVKFPNDGHPTMCAEAVNLYGDARDEIVTWDYDSMYIYTQDDAPKDDVYAPFKYPDYNASNYRGEYSYREKWW